MNKNTPLVVIGFSGKIGCGKTTVANLLKDLLQNDKEFLFNPHLLSFGGLLKNEVSKVYRIDKTYLYDQELKKETVEFDHITDEELLVKGKSKATVREVLQWYGTDYMRRKSKHYWVDAMDICIKNKTQHVNGIDVILIDDVRFNSEVDFINKYSHNYLIRLQPFHKWNEKYFNPENVYHQSEIELDDYTGFSRIMSPNYSELNECAMDIYKHILHDIRKLTI